MSEPRATTGHLPQADGQQRPGPGQSWPARTGFRWDAAWCLPADHRRRLLLYLLRHRRHRLRHARDQQAVSSCPAARARRGRRRPDRLCGRVDADRQPARSFRAVPPDADHHRHHRRRLIPWRHGHRANG